MADQTTDEAPVEDEERFSLGSAPELELAPAVDYKVPDEWMQREGDWPAPLYRRPDIEGLQRLRAPFAEGMVDKLPKGVRKNQDGSDPRPEHCKVCLGYHKPASFHLDYIGHARVTDRLNSIDPLWFWTPYAEDPITHLPLLDYDGQNRPCGMWMKLHVCGKTMIGYGTTEPKPDAIKELIGDALRNAAMRLGVALGMWVKGEMESLADTPESLGQQAAAAKPPERDPQTKQPKITKPQADDLVAMFDDITDDDERKKAKREWLDAFSIRRPGDLTQDHHDGAKLWIAARLDSSDAQAAPQEATDGPPEGGSTAESATTTVDEPQPSRPPAALPTWPTPEGMVSWEGELPAVPESGEVLYPPADYVTGIKTFLDGISDDKTAEFDAWIDDLGWTGLVLEEAPQWALFHAFNKLVGLADESAAPTTKETTDG